MSDPSDRPAPESYARIGQWVYAILKRWPYLLQVLALLMLLVSCSVSWDDGGFTWECMPILAPGG